MICRYFQNIHTGESIGCDCELNVCMCNITYSHPPIPDPQIGFVDMSVSVNEGMASVELSVMASAPGYVELSLGEGTATGQAVGFVNS